MRVGVFLLLLCFLFLSVNLVYSRSMWGSRRKREKEADEVSSPMSRKGKDTASAASGRGYGGVGRKSAGGIDASAIEEVANLYIGMMEELLESDDFERLVNPEAIQNMLAQFPGMNDNPEVATLFESPEFSDPALLKMTMRDGIEMVKTAVPELVALLNDPVRVAELLGQLPPDMQRLFEGLQSGDMSVFKGLIENLPGLDAQQKVLLGNLLDGNTDALSDQLQQVLGDAEQIEAARQQFLAAGPEMAEAMGISQEVLEDPQLWAQLMAQGVDALSGDAAGTATVETRRLGDEGGQQRKRFGRANRAAAAP